MRRHLLVPLLALPMPLLAGWSSPVNQDIELLDQPATASEELPPGLLMGGFNASELISGGWEQVQKNLFLKGLDGQRKPGRTR